MTKLEYCSHLNYQQVGESAIYECSECGHRIDISGTTYG